MNLTKPAGVAFQLIGVIVVFIGIGVAGQFNAPDGSIASVVWGILIVIFGGWMLRQGRHPGKSKPAPRSEASP